MELCSLDMQPAFKLDENEIANRLMSQQKRLGASIRSTKIVLGLKRDGWSIVK